MNPKTSLKVAKEASITYIGLVAGNIFRYLFTILLARWVGVEYLGIYSLGNAVTRLTEVIGKAGLDSGVLRFVSHHRGKSQEHAARSSIRSALKIGFVFSIIIMIIQIALSGWLAFAIFKSNALLKTLLIINAISLPFSIITLIAAWSTQGFQIMKYKVIVTDIFAPIILLISMVLLYFSLSAEAALYYPLLISAVISCFTIMYFLKKISGVSIKSIISSKVDFKILYFSSPLMMVAVIGTFMHWLDVTMLGYFTNSETVGLYYPAARTAGLLRSVLLAFISIFSPMMSQFYAQKNAAGMENLYHLVTRWIFTVSVPILILLLMFPSKFMLLFGPEYMSGSNTLIILSVAVFMQAIMGIGSPALTMTGHPKVNLVNSIVAVIINVILNIILIPKYGLEGAAWATLISLSLIGFARIIEVSVILKLPYLNRSFFKPVIAGITTWIFLSALKPMLMNYHTLITLLIGGISAIIVFGVVLLILKIEPEDLELLRAMKILKKGKSIENN